MSPEIQPFKLSSRKTPVCDYKEKGKTKLIAFCGKMMTTPCACAYVRAHASAEERYNRSNNNEQSYVRVYLLLQRKLLCMQDVWTRKNVSQTKLASLELLRCLQSSSVSAELMNTHLPKWNEDLFLGDYIKESVLAEEGGDGRPEVASYCLLSSNKTKDVPWSLIRPSSTNRFGEPVRDRSPHCSTVKRR